ncbi:hypothetical protein U0070_003920, partial [Myodes glareolus]
MRQLLHRTLHVQYVTQNQNGMIGISHVHKNPLQSVTEATMFILLGFTDDFELQVLLFLLFLAIYLFTLIGNFGLVVLVIGDSRLHNPVYYLLTIYNPLLYAVNMSPRVYVTLIIASYSGVVLHGTIRAVATFRLSNEIRHVFCDIPPLLALSCSDTRTNELLFLYLVGLIGITTILIAML